VRRFLLVLDVFFFDVFLLFFVPEEPFFLALLALFFIFFLPFFFVFVELD